MFPQVRASIVTPAIIIIFLVLTLLLSRRPYYNWDMFPYMAIAMADPTISFDSTHRAVYREARQFLPPSDYTAISQRQPALRDDPKQFEGILRYFTIKPGYNLVVALCYRLGVNPVFATCLPSLVSYCLIGCLVYFWNLRHAPPVPAALVALTVGLAPPMIDLARYSSPDMLCTLISLSGCMLLVRGLMVAGLASLFAATWVRPDASLLFILVAVSLSWGKLIRLPHLLILFGLASSSLFLLGPELTNEYLLLDTSLADRLAAYGVGLRSILQSYSLPALLIGLGTLYLRRENTKPDLSSLLVMAAVTSIALRFMLHPFIEDRFNLPACLLIALTAWDTLAARHYMPGESKR